MVPIAKKNAILETVNLPVISFLLALGKCSHRAKILLLKTCSFPPFGAADDKKCHQEGAKIDPSGPM